MIFYRDVSFYFSFLWLSDTFHTKDKFFDASYWPRLNFIKNQANSMSDYMKILCKDDWQWEHKILSLKI